MLFVQTHLGRRRCWWSFSPFSLFFLSPGAPHFHGDRNGDLPWPELAPLGCCFALAQSCWITFGLDPTSLESWETTFSSLPWAPRVAVYFSGGQPGSVRSSPLPPCLLPPPHPNLFSFSPHLPPGASSQCKWSLGSNDEDGCLIDSLSSVQPPLQPPLFPLPPSPCPSGRKLKGYLLKGESPQVQPPAGQFVSMKRMLL